MMENKKSVKYSEEEQKRFVNEMFSLSSSADNFIIEEKKSIFNNVLKLSKSFMPIYKKEKEKLPYHINILDLIWANENTHSRIFRKLLNQNSLGKYDILEQFYDYLNTIKPNFNNKPIKPQISNEKERIDLLIKDKDFALIIENKIHGAKDQPNQLARYIDKVGKGIKEEQIWIIYLTRNGGEPEDQSWGNYKEKFEERFIELSYRKHILPWLETVVLPNCRVKDVYLKSTLEQYIDYLQGMFNLRTNQNDMNKKLEEFITKELRLTQNPEEDLKTLREKQNELNKLVNCLSTISSSKEKECWSVWHNRLKSEYPNYDKIYYGKDEERPKVGLIMEFEGKKFSVLIQKNKGGIIYGIRRYKNESFKQEIEDLLKNSDITFNETSNLWYGYNRTSFENGYTRLETLIDKVINLINKKESK